jgi:hypothetical protein
MKKYLSFLVIFSATYFSGFAQTSSQTRTATRFNDLFESYLNLWYRQGAQYVSADDNSYAYTKRLSPHRGYISLFLQGFGFAIPPDATIDSITVRARRFKQGRGSIKDFFATLLKKDERYYLYDYEQYGAWWQGDPNYYSDIETEIIYSQSGTGTNSGGVAGQPYQWTPTMINDPDFGARIQNYEPEDGSVVVYYDLVEITVKYTQAVTIAGRSHDAKETRALNPQLPIPIRLQQKRIFNLLPRKTGGLSLNFSIATAQKSAPYFLVM